MSSKYLVKAPKSQEQPQKKSKTVKPEKKTPLWLLLPLLPILLSVITRYLRSPASTSLGISKYINTSAIVADEPKRAAIVEAFKHSYNAYERDAFGFDNYHPISRGGDNIDNNKEPIGYFILDCLDSLLLLGMDKEYQRARQWVATELSFDTENRHHAFEITIRALGGLLAAYHLSDEDQMYLDKAVDLADRLLSIFETPSGIPHSFVNLKKRELIKDRDNNNLASVAEAATLQLELRYLSEITGNPVYWERALKVMDIIKQNPKYNGLAPIFLSPEAGSFVISDIRLGSRGDSYYEYLLKLYLQSNGSEERWLDAYEEALQGIQAHLLAKGVNDGLLYTAEMQVVGMKNKQQPDYRLMPKQDHLVCFLPGLIFLGVSKDGKQPIPSSLDEKDDSHLELASELLRTCMDTYEKTATGLSPEIAFFYRTKEEAAAKKDTRDWYIDKRPNKIAGKILPPPLDARNILRPETLESLFVAYRITHLQKYRDQAWAIFEAFNKHCRIESGGYASIRDVDELPAVHEDRMETFWLAESLKYLYLIFSDDSVIPLDKYVFSTEAHILPTFDPTI